MITEKKSIILTSALVKKSCLQKGCQNKTKSAEKMQKNASGCFFLYFVALLFDFCCPVGTVFKTLRKIQKMGRILAFQKMILKKWSLPYFGAKTAKTP